ncbi:MAG: hypothetical protein U1A77_10275 [Pirellulales bacterium]
MNFTRILLFLLFCVIGISDAQSADECYFGIVETVQPTLRQIEIKLLPTNRKRTFTVDDVKPGFFDEALGKKVTVFSTDLDLPKKSKPVSARLVTSAEYETALLPLTSFILKQKQPTVAEDFLAWGIRAGETLASERARDAKFSGHLIVGRIACDENLDFQKLHSQARGFPGGFFLCSIRTPGKKVGIYYPGFMPLELDTDGPGPVQIVKNLKLVRPSPEQLGGFRVLVKLEGEKSLAEAYSVTHQPFPAQNSLYSLVTNPHPPEKTLIQQGAEVRRDKLPPGKYRVLVEPQRPSGVLTHRSMSLEFEVEPGIVNDLGELVIPKVKLIPISFALSTIPGLYARLAENAFLLPARLGNSNKIVADPATIDDIKTHKHYSWGAVLEHQSGQLIFQGGSVENKPLCALGPGPLTLYLDKYLHAQPLTPINDIAKHSYQTQYELTMGTVYLYRASSSKWILLQVGGELPKSESLEQARAKASTIWQSADFSKTDLKELPTITVAQLKASQFEASDLQAYRFRPGQGQLHAGTGLIPLGGTTAASSLVPNLLISRNLDGDFFGVERNSATLMSLARIGPGPLSKYSGKLFHQEEYIESRFTFIGAQAGTRQVPLEPNVVYLFNLNRGSPILFELDSKDKQVASAIASTPSLKLEIPSSLAIYAAMSDPNNGPGRLVQYSDNGRVLAERVNANRVSGLAFARDGLMLAIPNVAAPKQGQPGPGIVELLDWNGKTTEIPLPAEVQHPRSLAASPSLNHFVVIDQVARNAWFLPEGKASDAVKLINWNNVEKTRGEEPGVRDVIFLPSGQAFASIYPQDVYSIELLRVNPLGEDTNKVTYGHQIAARKEDNVWAVHISGSSLIRFYSDTKAFGEIKLPVSQRNVIDMEFLDSDTLLLCLDGHRDPFGKEALPPKLWYARLSTSSIEPAFEFTSRDVAAIAVGKRIEFKK